MLRDGGEAISREHCVREKISSLEKVINELLALTKLLIKEKQSLELTLNTLTALQVDHDRLESTLANASMLSKVVNGLLRNCQAAEGKLKARMGNLAAPAVSMETGISSRQEMQFLEALVKRDEEEAAERRKIRDDIRNDLTMAEVDKWNALNDEMDHLDDEVEARLKDKETQTQFGWENLRIYRS